MRLLRIWRITIEINFNPHDCWFGVFWRRSYASWIEFLYYHHTLDAWICLLPMLPIRISIRGSRIRPGSTVQGTRFI